MRPQNTIMKKIKVQQEFDCPLDVLLRAREERYKHLDKFPELKNVHIVSEERVDHILKQKRNISIADSMPPIIGSLLPSGADTLAGLPTWREPDVLLELAHMVAVTRPGHELDAAPLPPSALTTVEIPGVDISSTICRERVARGEPIDYLVPAAVVEYIGKHQLYR